MRRHFIIRFNEAITSPTEGLDSVLFLLLSPCLLREMTEAYICICDVCWVRWNGAQGAAKGYKTIFAKKKFILK